MYGVNAKTVVGITALKGLLDTGGCFVVHYYLDIIAVNVSDIVTLFNLHAFYGSYLSPYGFRCSFSFFLAATRNRRWMDYTLGLWGR